MNCLYDDFQHTIKMQKLNKDNNKRKTILFYCLFYQNNSVWKETQQQQKQITVSQEIIQTVSMGNHQQHQQIQSKINSFEVLQKGSHFTVLKDQEGTEYVKFLYAMIESEDKEAGLAEAKQVKASSIFNRNYLRFRFQLQNSGAKMDMLPKIIALGEQTQGDGLIYCSKNKINFAVFQHPYKRSLKHQVESRISTGSTFEEHQLYKLIKAVCEGLSQYFQHIKDWNQQILERKTFTISEDNIFIKKNGEFLVSDIISQLNHIEQISKQEVTLCKSMKSSMTNLHAKMSVNKLKQKFFESNFCNLASIVESIIFKFHCFSQPSKNSHESQSLSTALQSCRGLSKNPNNFSGEMDKILKELRQPFVNENQIINSVERVLNSIRLPTPAQSSMDFSSVLEKNNVFVQKSTIKLFGQTQKSLNGVNQINASNVRQPLCELTENYHQEISGQNNKIHQKLMNKRFSDNYLSRDDDVCQRKFQKKSKSKLRLSLKKDTQNIKQIQPNTVTSQDSLKRKFSQPKFIAHKNINNKQNEISFKIHSIGFPLQTKNVVHTNNAPQKWTQTALMSKSGKVNNNIKDVCDKQRKKVFLKKPIIRDELIQCENGQIVKKEQQAALCEPSYHLNPMSRKRNLGISKVLPLKIMGNENVPAFKTIEKTKHEPDMDLIDNLSSIVSNQNNTMSSCGIPTTEEFKTQNSMIQQQGCVGFNEIMEIDSGRARAKSKGSVEGQGFSPPCSYPSIESNGDQKSKEKIPQFLKKFKLPEKHLVALNNIILTQKDVIFQQSFQQSDFNSIRHSIPNILCLDQEFSELQKKRSSKVILGKIDEMVKNGGNKIKEVKYKLEDQPEVISFEMDFSRELQRENKFIEKQEESLEFPLCNHVK